MILSSQHYAGIEEQDHTRAQIKDPEKVTNKMYGCNTDISSHFFRIFNLRPSISTNDWIDISLLHVVSLF